MSKDSLNEVSPAPRRRRRWPAILAVALAGLALLALTLAVMALYLPRLVSDRLVMEATRRLGDGIFSGRITAIGPYRTTAGPFFLGHADRPALSIGSVEIDYTPGELRRKRIRLIRIRDVVVDAVVTSDGVSLPGVDPATLKRQPQDHRRDEQTPVAAPGIPLAVRLERLEIQSGRLQLRSGNTDYRIPFTLDLKSTDADSNAFDARLRLFPRDQTLTLTAAVDLNWPSARLQVDAQTIALGAFSDLIRRIPGLDVNGEASLRANGDLSFSPLAVTDMHAELTWRHGRIRYDPLSIEPVDIGAAATLTVNAADTTSWRLQASGIRLSLPVPLAMESLAATVDRNGGGLAMTGAVTLRLPPVALDPSSAVWLNTALRLPLCVAAKIFPDGKWTAELGSLDTESKPAPLELALPHLAATIRADMPRIHLAAEGDDGASGIRGSLRLGKIRTTLRNAAVDLPSLVAEGAMQTAASSDGLRYDGNATIRFPGLQVDGYGLSGRLEKLSLTARVRKTAGGPPSVDARLEGAAGGFAHAASGVVMAGVQVDLPMGWNAGQGESTGHFRVARISRADHDLGALDGGIRRQADTYTLDATLVSDLLPGLAVTAHGTVQTATDRFGDSAFTITVPSWSLPAESDLGRFLPAAAGVNLSGRIDAVAAIDFSSGRLTGDMALKMVDGHLQIPQKKVSVDGIAAELRFPDLPRVRSAPAQPLRFSRAALGGIVVDGGSFALQLESPTTLFVEKGRLSWCGGKVDAGSLRITAGVQDYNLNLYCQRIGLSRILEQLGAINAKGTGTVNGRIPIAYNKGRIRFDDGFLFSTPGEGGQIQLAGTDILTRGIPPDTPQFAQVELAREALKDYAYDWVKLGLVSEDEDFVLRLQFDGKPTHPLPFVYNREIGSFMRVESGGAGSIFQGIGLDVNLRLPLNQLLQYKDIVKMIQ